MESKQETSKSEPPPTQKSSTNNAQPIHPDEKIIDWNSPDIIIEDDDDPD